jgi:hypothetical protein
MAKRQADRGTDGALQVVTDETQSIGPPFKMRDNVYYVNLSRAARSLLERRPAK